MNRRPVLAGLLATMQPWATQAADKAAAPRPDGRLVLAVSQGPVSLPVYVAESRQLFAAEGLALEMRHFSSGRQCFEAMLQDQADLATCAELLVVLEHLRSPRAAVVLATLSSSSEQIKLVARRSAGILVPADLRGKRVATVGRTSAEFFLDQCLLMHGLQPEQVQRVHASPQGLLDELTQRRVDAVAVWEPLASAALAALGADGVLLPAGSVYRQHFVLAIRPPTLAAQADNVDRLLRALLRAERVITERPEEAAAVLGQRLQWPLDTARRAMAEHSYRLGLTPGLLSTMDAQIRWSGQYTARGSRLLDAVDPAPLRRVAPLAVTLPRS